MRPTPAYDTELRMLTEMERWLTRQLEKSARSNATPGVVACPAAECSAAQRLRLVETLLERNPALATAVRGLALVEQLRINLELIGTPAVVAPARVAVCRAPLRCVAVRRGRRR